MDAARPVAVSYAVGVQVAIYADRHPGGKKLIATLQRRLKNEEIRAWEVKKKAPFTQVHSGDHYTKIRVTFVQAGPPTLSRAAPAGAPDPFRQPHPPSLRTISDA